MSGTDSENAPLWDESRARRDAGLGPEPRVL